MLIFGHRGAAGHAPENTLASVCKALDLGVDWVEIDVRRVEDALVVLHDSTVNRTTNGRGNVSSFSLRDLRGLDAGGGERIPFLKEVFDLIGRRCGINIELKGPGTAGPAADLAVRCIRERGWSPDRILISSFDVKELRRVRERSAELPLAPLSLRLDNDVLDAAAALRADAVHLHHRFVRSGTVESVHSRNLKLHVYTVNDVRRIRRLYRLGVDGIFSDYPERVIRVGRADQGPSPRARSV